jgi:hypothetical protein
MGNWVDCLLHWWQVNQTHYHNFKKWLIALDGEVLLSSDRTQFLKRGVEFARTIHCRIRLIDYSLHHKKYNPIKQCCPALEND